MKKIYEKPAMLAEEFIPNECVANCGDTEYGKYLFACNAPGGILYYYRGYPASGTEPGEWSNPPQQGTTAIREGGYGPCGHKHEASTKADFYYGFIDYDSDRTIDVYPEDDPRDERCIVYLEKNRWGQIIDYHATKVLDQESWEVVKS